MSNHNLNSQSTSPRLKKVILTNKIKLEIPENVLDEIKYLCKNIASDEWSGLLFYTVEGTIRDTSNMKIVLKGIFLMDKGSKTYTSFDWDEDIVEYRMNNPESLDWIVGHIHSHNTMSVFFSDTDWSELNDGCPHHNFYLSVIVNNYLDIQAKVALMGESKLFACKDETGADFNLSLSSSDLDRYMFVYDCVREGFNEEVIVSDEFQDRIKIVEEKSKKKQQEKLAIQKHNDYSSQQNSFQFGNKSSFPDYTPRGYRKSMKTEEAEIRDFFMEEGFSDLCLEDDSEDSLEYLFATFILKLGEVSPDDDLMSVLEEIEAQNINGRSLAISISETYGALYEQFFDKEEDKYKEDTGFLEVIEKVATIYSEYTTDYKFLRPIIGKLKEMRSRYIKYLNEKDNGKKYSW